MVGRAPQAALRAQQLSARGGGLRGPRDWLRRGAGAPNTASSLCSESSRAHAGLCRASVQGLASRGSATGQGPRSALSVSEAQMDPGLLPGLCRSPGWRGLAGLGWGND